jgi:hypothetical protein
MAYAIPKITYGGFVPTVINFTYPPVEKEAPSLDAVEKVSKSKSGVRQISVDYFEEKRTLNFRWLTETQKAELQTFFLTHAGRGKSFRYYDDGLSATYADYILDDLKFRPKKITSVGVDVYIYEVSFTFVRVEGNTSGDCMIVTLANNQAVAANVSGLLFDSADTRTAEVYCEIYRATDTNEKVFRGKFLVAYRTLTSTWEITQIDGNGDVDHGVTLSITGGGQVQYVSDNLAGTNYTGYIELKELSLC